MTSLWSAWQKINWCSSDSSTVLYYRKYSGRANQKRPRASSHRKRRTEIRLNLSSMAYQQRHAMKCQRFDEKISFVSRLAFSGVWRRCCIINRKTCRGCGSPTTQYDITEHCTLSTSSSGNIYLHQCHGENSIYNSLNLHCHWEGNWIGCGQLLLRRDSGCHELCPFFFIYLIPTEKISFIYSLICNVGTCLRIIFITAIKKVEKNRKPT